MSEQIDTRDDGHATTGSWSEMASDLTGALGGMILGVQAMVLIPGLLPGIALTALLLLPFLVLGAIAAIAISVPLLAVRLGRRVVRR